MSAADKGGGPQTEAGFASGQVTIEGKDESDDANDGYYRNLLGLNK